METRAGQSCVSVCEHVRACERVLAHVSVCEHVSMCVLLMAHSLLRVVSRFVSFQV